MYSARVREIDRQIDNHNTEITTLLGLRCITVDSTAHVHFQHNGSAIHGALLQRSNKFLYKQIYYTVSGDVKQIVDRLQDTKQSNALHFSFAENTGETSGNAYLYNMHINIGKLKMIIHSFPIVIPPF
jgi:hypothetical protein